MRGIEIMLIGIYSAIHNGTYLNDTKKFEIEGNIEYRKLNESNVNRLSRERENPMPTEIKVTSWQNMPYSGLKKMENGKYELTGYAFELLKLIQSKLNFTYTVIPPEPQILGDTEKGVMKQLYNKEVDMAVSFIPVTPNLQKICTFSVNLDDVEVTFLMKRPRESAVGSGLLAPFNNTVWYCILVALIVVGPIIYVLIYIRTKISSRGHPEGYPLSTCIWFTYGALLKQGSTVTPVTDSTRLLFATWWIFITILTSFYTANLTAFLTLSEFTLPFATIKDITRKHQKWVSFFDHIVGNTINTTYQEQLIALNTSLTRKEGSYINSYNNESIERDFGIVKKAVNSGPLFIGEKYFIQDLIYHDYRTKTIARIEEAKRCNLVMLPKKLYANNRAFAYPMNSSIAMHIDKHLTNLVETGIVMHLKKKLLPTVKYCPLNLKSMERRLRNTDLTMTYYCVGVGFTLATIVFIGEMIHRIVQLRKGYDCGNCCDRLSCRMKIKSAELPIYKHDPPPNVSKQKVSMINDSLCNSQMAKKHIINGRDYWVIKEENGDKRLVPIRTPSALLFHNYTSYLDIPNDRDIPKL